MAATACFIIVSRNNIPIYEAEVGSAPKKEDAAQQHQFILHAALDIVQDLAWTTSAMFLKGIDRFNDLVVSLYVTAGQILRVDGMIYTRLMLLHDSRNDDGIKSFFQEVHELYIKILLNPPLSTWFLHYISSFQYKSSSPCKKISVRRPFLLLEAEAYYSAALAIRVEFSVVLTSLVKPTYSDEVRTPRSLA